MQASVRRGEAYNVMGTEVRLELPDSVPPAVREALDFSLVRAGSYLPGCGRSEGGATSLDSLVVRLSLCGDVWRIETEGRHQLVGTIDEVLVCLQEHVLEDAALRRGDRLLIRGSVVTRGSQSILIVGDRGAASDTVLAAALTALDFHIVSVGSALFDGRCLAPVPAPLAFRLEPVDQVALSAAGARLERHLAPLSETLFRPQSVVPGPELTHAFFLSAPAGSRSVFRPISIATARTRLCTALMAAPSDQSPFAAIAGLLRHTRAIDLSVGELSQTLEQLSRLLPRWRLQ